MCIVVIYYSRAVQLANSLNGYNNDLIDSAQIKARYIVIIIAYLRTGFHGIGPPAIYYVMSICLIARNQPPNRSLGRKFIVNPPAWIDLSKGN